MPTLLDEHLVNFNYTWLKVNDDTLCLHPGSHNLDADDFIYTVKHYFKTLNKKTIAFNDWLESPRKQYIEFINTVGKKLIDDLQIDPSSCLYFSGAAPTSVNTEKYNNLITNNNLLNIPIRYTNYFEFNFANILNCDRRPIFSNPILPKRYKFLFLAGSHRLHRTWLLVNFIKHNILQNCNYSFFANKKEITEKMDGMLGKLFTKDDINLILNTDHSFPKFINILMGEWNLQHQLRSSDVDNFSTSYLSIVAETMFFQHEYGAANPYADVIDYHYNFTFLTEKTYRAISLKHPFILASLPNSLGALRELGYKTFSPYIDESYDTIEDDQERLEKILSIIKNFNSFTEKQWIEFYYNTKDIVEYNYNVIKSQKFKIV
jgi:hypothetical protein